MSEPSPLNKIEFFYDRSRKKLKLMIDGRNYELEDVYQALQKEKKLKELLAKNQSYQYIQLEELKKIVWGEQ